jgi:hypothetical protein
MLQRAADRFRTPSIQPRIRCLLAMGLLFFGAGQRNVWAQDRSASTIVAGPLAPAPIADAIARLAQRPPVTAPGRSSLARYPVLLGAGIGAAGAAAWQATACRGSACNTGTAALVGAGVGAYTGLVVSAVQSALAGRPVSRRVKIGLAVGAIGAVGGGWLACYGAGGCGGVS